MAKIDPVLLEDSEFVMVKKVNCPNCGCLAFVCASCGHRYMMENGVVVDGRRKNKPRA